MRSGGGWACYRAAATAKATCLPPPSLCSSFSFSQPASQSVLPSVRPSPHFQTIRESTVNLRPPLPTAATTVSQDGHGRISSLPKESTVLCNWKCARSREKERPIDELTALSAPSLPPISPLPSFPTPLYLYTRAFVVLEGATEVTTREARGAHAILDAWDRRPLYYERGRGSLHSLPYSSTFLACLSA